MTDVMGVFIFFSFLVIYEHRYSKIGLEKTFTLCGHQDYVAPEQISHAGKSKRKKRRRMNEADKETAHTNQAD